MSFQKGQQVTIIGVNFARHAEMVGKTGIIKRITKKMILINLDGGGIWEAFPENISANPADQGGLF